MTPFDALLLFGGVAFILLVFSWLLFRLGGFTVTERERRTWRVGALVLVPALIALAFIGPLPLPIILVVNAALLAYWVWIWRTKRFALESIPTDVRDEVGKRRRWMGEHKLVLVGLFFAFMVASTAWAIVVLLLSLARNSP